MLPSAQEQVAPIASAKRGILHNSLRDSARQAVAPFRNLCSFGMWIYIEYTRGEGLNSIGSIQNAAIPNCIAQPGDALLAQAAVFTSSNRSCLKVARTVAESSFRRRHPCRLKRSSFATASTIQTRDVTAVR